MKRARMLSLIGFLMIVAFERGWGQYDGLPLPSLREQAQIQQEWLRIRLEKILPKLMRENNVEMWIVPMREYNEDPVFSSLVSPATFSARRRSVYVFFDRGIEKGVERIALGGGAQGGLYTAFRDTTLGNAELWGNDQWKLLTNLVKSRNPRTIAVDISETHAFSDGLTAGEWGQLQEALGPEFLSRIVKAERLPLDYIAIRLPDMLPIYRQLMKMAHAIIGEAFSNAVIVPGKTTTDDVVWWMRQKTQSLGLGTWFQPSVNIQRKGVDSNSLNNPVILPGDVLHCDFGVSAMRLNTDSQHMGYVLRKGETDVPSGLKKALSNSNRLQDILLENMRVGLTGNQILRNALEQMKRESIEGTVYTHPIGEHGHGAGAIIGLWDRQKGVPGRGDLPLLPNTWYSVELQATTVVAEWDGQKVRSAQEDDITIDLAGRTQWVLSRQAVFHLVK
jgi:hypothetical protein